jgi:hypothetical protein
MIRSFDLAMNQEALNHLLDNPTVQLQEIKVMCSDTGYTTATLQYRLGEAPFPKRKRRVERYLMFYGINLELNTLLESKRTRLVKLYDFQSEQGTIVVVDYQIKEG